MLDRLKIYNQRVDSRQTRARIIFANMDVVDGFQRQEPIGRPRIFSMQIRQLTTTTQELSGELRISHNPKPTGRYGQGKMSALTRMGPLFLRSFPP